MFCRNSSLQAVCDTPIARITGWLCVLIKDIGRRLPLQLQCSYQGQQGDDVRQSVRENYKTHFWGGGKSDSCGRKCISLSSESCKS